MATPRITRAKSRSQEPLPAVGTRTSEAYGAKGKANLFSQLESSGDDFATAFGTTRRGDEASEANPSQGDQDTIAVSESPKKRGRPPKAKSVPDLSAVEEEDDEADETVAGPSRIGNTTTFTGRPNTSIAVDQTQPYFGRDRAIRSMDVLRGPGPRAARAAEAPIADHPVDHPVDHPADRPTAPVDQDDVAAARPLTLRVTDLFLALLSFFFFATIFAYVPLPASMSTVNHYREHFYWGLKYTFAIRPYDVPPTELEERWNRFSHEELLKKHLPDYNVPKLQWFFNKDFLTRLQTLEQQMVNVQQSMALQAETLDQLRKTLPEEVAVRVVDGKYEIPQEFWAALQERFETDSDLTPLWKAYVQRNEAQTRDWSNRNIHEQLDQIIQEKEIITKESFLRTITENNDWLVNQYKDQVQQMQDRSLKGFKQIAADAARNEIQKYPITNFANEQVENLAKLNQVHNLYESLHGRNWFSISLGARINPHMTSSTQEIDHKTWSQTLFPWFSPPYLKPNPPIAALARWEEANDCWCAAAEKSGKAQISIITPARIFPEHLVIEHIPALSTLNIAAAPRVVEVWALASSAREAEEAIKAIRQSGPDCESKPSPESVCIASGRYDIHGPNHVQTIPVSVDTQAIGLGVNRFLVRVVANWGSENTCLYRLRMTGEAA